MPSNTPFVDPLTNELDTDQILREAIPLAKLIAAVGAVALVPLLFVFLFGSRSSLGAIFVLAAQFIAAVGTGVVLMYVVARAIALSGADDRTIGGDGGPRGDGRTTTSDADSPSSDRDDRDDDDRDEPTGAAGSNADDATTSRR